MDAMQNFLQFLKDNPYSVGIVAIIFSFFGLFIGNWQAIGRDRRSERIEVAQRVREKLLKARNDLRPVRNCLSSIDEDLLMRVLSPLQRRSFQKAVNEYRKESANHIQNSLGEISFRSPDAVASAIDNLLPYTAKR